MLFYDSERLFTEEKCAAVYNTYEKKFEAHVACTARRLAEHNGISQRSIVKVIDYCRPPPRTYDDMVDTE